MAVHNWHGRKLNKILQVFMCEHDMRIDIPNERSLIFHFHLKEVLKNLQI